jgi:hypothetical protein
MSALRRPADRLAAGRLIAGRLIAGRLTAGLVTAGLGVIALTGGTLFGPGNALASASAGGPVLQPARASVQTSTPKSPHRGILPPKNPSRSVSPDSSFLSSRHCAGGQDGSACNSVVLKAITHARKVLEKLAGMSFSLPAYEKLTPDEQLFVTANLERTERGLPAATVLTRSLDTIAQDGANADNDPSLGQVPAELPGGGRPVGIGGNWAGGWDNALGADYAWMYDDGPGSSNGDCTTTDKAGCWGHRDNILGTFSRPSICGGGSSELAMGAGHVTRGKAYGDSEAELFVGVCGPTPTDVVLTWTKAKKLLHI